MASFAWIAPKLVVAPIYQHAAFRANAGQPELADVDERLDLAEHAAHLQAMHEGPAGDEHRVLAEFPEQVHGFLPGAGYEIVLNIRQRHDFPQGSARRNWAGSRVPARLVAAS